MKERGTKCGKTLMAAWLAHGTAVYWAVAMVVTLVVMMVDEKVGL